MNLGNAFSREAKIETFQRSFHAGRILHLFCGFTRPSPKEKFVVVGCAAPRPLVIVVNSEIREFVKRRPRLLVCQVMLSKNDYSCLHHDSYLDCSRAIDYFTQAIVENQVVRDMARIKMCLTKADTANVIKAIEAAETIPLRDKLWMLDELKRTLN